ncbi:MAG: hypothetical protein ACOCX9_08365, partial [Spirochaetota bacterium]
MIDCRNFTFTPISDKTLEVDLYHYLEYVTSASAPSAVRKSIHRAIIDFTGYTKTDFICRTIEIDSISDDHINTVGTLNIQSQRLAAMASKTSSPSYITAYAITLGPGIDDIIAERQKDSMLDA